MACWRVTFALLDGGECCNFRPGRITQGKGPGYSMNRSLGVPKGRFGKKEKFVLCTGIRNPNRPLSSLVSIPTTLSCVLKSTTVGKQKY